MSTSTLYRLKSRVAYFLEGLWLPIHANLVGLHHLIRGHNIKWFQDPDLWNAHLGWIYCHNCADTGDNADLCIWGFYFHRVHRLMQWVCGYFGHRESKESLTYRENDDDPDAPYDVPTGHFYCSRCLADSQGPT